MTPEQYISTGTTLKWLLAARLAAAAAGLLRRDFGGYWGRHSDVAAKHKNHKLAAYLAVGCIATGFVLSAIAMTTWLGATGVSLLPQEEAHAQRAGSGSDSSRSRADGHATFA